MPLGVILTDSVTSDTLLYLTLCFQLMRNDYNRNSTEKIQSLLSANEIWTLDWP